MGASHGGTEGQERQPGGMMWDPRKEKRMSAKRSGANGERRAGPRSGAGRGAIPKKKGMGIRGLCQGRSGALSPGRI